MANDNSKFALRMCQFLAAISLMFAFEMAVDSMVIHPSISRSVRSNDEMRSMDDDDDGFQREVRNVTGDPWIDQLTDPPLQLDPSSNKTVIYSLKRSDRSGEIIRDMVLCHMYCVNKGWIYGGACPLRRYLLSPEKEEERLAVTKSIIRAIGLQDTLAFRCPPKKHIDTSRSAGEKHMIFPDHKPHKFPKHLGLLDRSKYSKGFRSIPFSTEYIEFLRSKMQLEDIGQNDYATKPYTIVAHVRRGDVGVCNRWSQRYIPNGYFIHLIEQYKAEYRKKMNDPELPVRVIVHTEAADPLVQQMESADEFRELGYEVSVQGSEARVWKDIIHEADVVLLSASTFSILPAMLGDANRTEYVYLQYARAPPRPGWRSVSEEETKLIRDLRIALRHRCNIE